MASETITRNDLTAILNEVLPSATNGYYYASGSNKSVPAGGSVTNVHTYTPSKGTWLILSKIRVVSGSSSNQLQNRLPSSNVKGVGDTALSINNYVTFVADGNSSVAFNTFASVACTVDWEFVAVQVQGGRI